MGASQGKPNPFIRASDEGEGKGHDLDSKETDLPDDVARSWMLIHTDDCDAYGTNMDVLHEINSIMNDEWTTEIVDSSFVLGVKRELTIDPNTGEWSVKMSMRAFLEDLYNLFSDAISEA